MITVFRDQEEYTGGSLCQAVRVCHRKRTLEPPTIIQAALDLNKDFKVVVVVRPRPHRQSTHLAIVPIRSWSTISAQHMAVGLSHFFF